MQGLIRTTGIAIALCTLAGNLLAQTPPAAPAAPPAGPPQFPNMTFFITSTGGPAGANFGGLERIPV